LFEKVFLVIVDSQELKNSLEKYLRLSASKEIIITSNGRKVARLSGYEDVEMADDDAGYIQEEAPVYRVAPRRTSYEEFLDLVESSEERYEYIDGEIYLLASPKTSHQNTLGEIFFIFRGWFEGKKCHPMLAPYDITLKRSVDDINVVQPDLMVVCDLEEKVNDKDYYMGVPVLVVEITSESSRSKDFVKKLDLYMSTGIREYWIVNPLNREVCVYLFEQNEISKNITYKHHDTAASFHFVGLEVGLDTIFEIAADGSRGEMPTTG
jgi:prevent-host-death family protein